MLLQPEALDRIVAIGRACNPREACGIVLLSGEVIIVPNKAKDPIDGYELHFEDVKEWTEQLLSWEAVVWHTHPSGLVGPSRRDMKSRIPELQYLVVTLDGVASQF